jgi:hypothetical protein
MYYKKTLPATNVLIAKPAGKLAAAVLSGLTEKEPPKTGGSFSKSLSRKLYLSGFFAFTATA